MEAFPARFRSIGAPDVVDIRVAVGDLDRGFTVFVAQDQLDRRGAVNDGVGYQLTRNQFEDFGVAECVVRCEPSDEAARRYRAGRVVRDCEDLAARRRSATALQLPRTRRRDA